MKRKDKRKNNGNTQRKNGFTRKEKAFISSYLTCFNATKAAREAGYEVGEKKERGWKLLQKPHIIDEIHRRITKRENKLEISADDVLKEYMRIAFFDRSVLYDKNHNFIGLENVPKQARALIKSIKKKKTQWGTDITVDLYSKEWALEKITMHLGMMLPKLKVDVNKKTQIEITLKKEELKKLGVEKLLEISNLMSSGEPQRN